MTNLKSLLARVRPYIVDSAHEWQERPDHGVHGLLREIETALSTPEPPAELRAGDEIEYVDDGDTGVIVGIDPDARAVVRWTSGVISRPMLSKLRRAVNRS
jgi:hypothetical protein